MLCRAWRWLICGLTKMLLNFSERGVFKGLAEYRGAVAHAGSDAPNLMNSWGQKFCVTVRVDKGMLVHFPGDTIDDAMCKVADAIEERHKEWGIDRDFSSRGRAYSSDHGCW
jgi:hypothetical protein